MLLITKFVLLSIKQVCHGTLKNNCNFMFDVFPCFNYIKCVVLIGDRTRLCIISLNGPKCLTLWNTSFFTTCAGIPGQSQGIKLQLDIHFSEEKNCIWHWQKTWFSHAWRRFMFTPPIGFFCQKTQWMWLWVLNIYSTFFSNRVYHADFLKPGISGKSFILLFGSGIWIRSAINAIHYNNNCLLKIWVMTHF